MSCLKELRRKWERVHCISRRHKKNQCLQRISGTILLTISRAQNYSGFNSVKANKKTSHRLRTLPQTPQTPQVSPAAKNALPRTTKPSGSNPLFPKRLSRKLRRCILAKEKEVWWGKISSFKAISGIIRTKITFNYWNWTRLVIKFNENISFFIQKH